MFRVYFVFIQGSFGFVLGYRVCEAASHATAEELAEMMEAPSRVWLIRTRMSVAVIVSVLMLCVAIILRYGCSQQQ